MTVVTVHVHACVCMHESAYTHIILHMGAQQRTIIVKHEIMNRDSKKSLQ